MAQALITTSSSALVVRLLASLAPSSHDSFWRAARSCLAAAPTMPRPPYTAQASAPAPPPAARSPFWRPNGSSEHARDAAAAASPRRDDPRLQAVNSVAPQPARSRLSFALLDRRYLLRTDGASAPVHVPVATRNVISQLMEDSFAVASAPTAAVVAAPGAKRSHL